MAWNVNKREFLAGSMAGAAVACGAHWLPGRRFSEIDRRIALALVDDRTPLGRRLDLELRGSGIRTVSLQTERESLWNGTRAGFGLGSDEAMIGLTPWSDWSAIRPVLAEHRKLARAEFRIDRASMAVADILDALSASLPRETIIRMRFGGIHSRRTQFAWLVA